jgi:hypothetical protein
VQLLQDLLDAQPGRLNNSYGWALAEVSYSSCMQCCMRDPVPFLPLDPGSGIGFFRIPDLGPQTHIFESLFNFLPKNLSLIL